MISSSQIERAVEANWQKHLEWLQTLVRFPSQRGQEGPCQDWIANSFRSRGWSVDRYLLADVAMEHLPGFSPVMDTDYAQAVQVVAALRAPKPVGRSLILQGHVDVVPVGPETMWSHPPYSAHISDGKMYGRGACDMKSGVSCMVFALDALAELGYLPGSDVYVETVTEEEATGNGALSTLARGYRADACFIPEPTGKAIGRGQIGVMWFRLIIRGRPAHAAENEQGTNAILSAYRLIEALQHFTSELNERVKAHPWYKSINAPVKFNPGKIRGGDWASSTPAWCEVDCRIGVLPGLSLAEFRQEISDVVMRAAGTDPFLSEDPPQIVWNGFQGETFVLEPGSDFEATVREAHKAIVGEEMQEWLFTGITDARFYGLYYDIPSMCYGPSGALMHGFDEYVDLDSVKQTTCVIADFIQRWCGLRKI